jgi:replicative DNA helicase
MWEVVCWPAVKEWNSKNDPPLDERELRGTFDSIMRREYNNREEDEPTDVESLKNYDGPDRVASFQEIHQEILDLKEPEFKFFSKIKTLDLLCDGFVPGEVIIISGPTKHGKTSLSTSMTTSFSDDGIKSMWFSFEMLPREFLKKFPILPISFMSKQQKDRDMKWLEQRIIESKLKFGVQIVFIDHLHFLFDMLRSKNSSIELGAIVRTLKSIARDNGMVIFLIVHIKRRESGRAPNEDDLRDSALLAAEADATLMVWRIPIAKSKRGQQVEYSVDAAIKVCNHRRTGVLGRALRVKYINGMYKEVSENYDESGETSQSDVDSILGD